MLSLPAATVRELCVLALAELDTYEHVVQEVKINSGGCHEFTVLQDIQHYMEDTASNLGIGLKEWLVSLTGKIEYECTQCDLSGITCKRKMTSLEYSQLHQTPCEKHSGCIGRTSQWWYPVKEKK